MSESTSTLGFIGLGVMGGPMSRNVVRKHAGKVYAFDMSEPALQETVEAGAIAAGSVPGSTCPQQSANSVTSPYPDPDTGTICAVGVASQLARTDRRGRALHGRGHP